jgi:hypothetical protein
MRPRPEDGAVVDTLGRVHRTEQIAHFPEGCAGVTIRGRDSFRRNGMPLFMDIHHKIDGLTAEAIKGAHEQDVKVQEQYGVKYHKYWFDEGSGKAFCLVEAPDKESANAVHREAHGLVADEIIEVQEGN